MPKNAQKRTKSGKYLTSESTRAFATAGNRVLTEDCGYGSRRGETLSDDWLRGKLPRDRPTN